MSNFLVITYTRMYNTLKVRKILNLVARPCPEAQVAQVAQVPVTNEY